METKLLYTIGNLYTGYPYGVEVTYAFGSVELHGPFSTENEADHYMHDLIKEQPSLAELHPIQTVKVVKIETPQAGRLIVRDERAEENYAYA